ncbi:MAG: ankyrin repeat domain-containing protein, partial [Bacteroidetes bacterium]|nr:ankyrin repeat domain-containing protein [Bacteroidota bacterium]
MFFLIKIIFNTINTKIVILKNNNFLRSFFTMARFRITHWYLVLLILVGGFASGCSMLRSDTLQNAVRAEDIKKVQNHMDAGANVNQTNHNGQTPLHLAARKGYKEVAGMLIGNRANVEAKDKQRRT